MQNLTGRVVPNASRQIRRDAAQGGVFGVENGVKKLMDGSAKAETDPKPGFIFAAFSPHFCEITVLIV